MKVVPLIVEQNYVDAISLSHIVSGGGGTPFAICIVKKYFNFYFQFEWNIKSNT